MRIASYFYFVFSFSSLIFWFTYKISLNFFLFFKSSSERLLVSVPINPSRSFFCFWMVSIWSLSYPIIALYSISLFFYFFIWSCTLSLSYFYCSCLKAVIWDVNVFIYSRYSLFYFRIWLSFAYNSSFSFNSYSFLIPNYLFFVKSSTFSADNFTIYFFCFFTKSFSIFFCYSLNDLSLSNLYSSCPYSPFFCIHPNSPSILFSPFWYPFSFSTSPAFNLRFAFKALNKNSCDVFTFVI